MGQGTRGVQQADGTPAGVQADRRRDGRGRAGRARGGQQDQEHPVYVSARAEKDQGIGAASPGPVRGRSPIVAVRAQAPVVPHPGLDGRRWGRETPLLVPVHRRNAGEHPPHVLCLLAGGLAVIPLATKWWQVQC